MTTPMHQVADVIAEEGSFVALLTSLGWPIVISYSTFRIVLVFGRHDDGKFIERVTAGLGGLAVWYARIIFGMPGGADVMDWTLALVLFGVSLMVLPKLIDMTRRAFMSQRG